MMGRFLIEFRNHLYEQLMAYDSSACNNGTFDKAEVVLQNVTLMDFFIHAIKESDPGKITEWVNEKYSEITSKEEHNVNI